MSFFSFFAAYTPDLHPALCLFLCLRSFLFVALFGLPIFFTVILTLPCQLLYRGLTLRAALAKTKAYCLGPSSENRASSWSLGRALGHFIYSLIGLKRILCTNIVQKL